MHALFHPSFQRLQEDCRFSAVCARCASECGGDIQSGALMGSPSSMIPVCRACPEGSTTRHPGGMIDTLEILPGFYRSSLASTDVRECMRKEACVGGVMPSGYCAEGYSGPCMLIASLVLCFSALVFVYVCEYARVVVSLCCMSCLSLIPLYSCS